MKYVSVAEMQAVEREADASGFSYAQMMENAGRNLAAVIAEVYAYADEKEILGLVGSGNNGGDTLVALAYLAEQGWQTSAYILRPRSPDDPLIKRLLEAGGKLASFEDDPNRQELRRMLHDNTFWMDGVLGTGARLPLKPELAQELAFTRKILDDIPEPPIIIAVDCPSGIDCDSGEAAPECLPAAITITMAAIKQGMLKFPAYDLCGDIRLVGIGLPDDGEKMASWQAVHCTVADEDWMRLMLPLRPNNSHKGTFGTALVVAGSVNYTGAALLAGQAAYRAGAGLVTLAVPSPLHSALSGQFPEATWLLLPHEMGVIAAGAAEVVAAQLERATALLIGPGFGLEDTTGEFLSRLLTSSTHHGSGKIGFVRATAEPPSKESPKIPPLVVDADGLKLLKRIPDWPAHLPAETILTPHPGEMSVLTGLTKEEIQADRLEIARKFSREWGHIVVLKGAFTIIAAPDGEAAIIPVATSALARAGTGDVLAGLIVGLRAQGMPAFSAAVAGAWIHAQAGLMAAESLGNTASVLAGDVLRASIDVISSLQ